MKRVLSVVLSVILLGLSPVLYPLRLHAEEATSEGGVPVVAGVSMSISADFGIHFYIRAPEGALQVGAYIEEERVTGERQEDGSYRVSFRHLAPKQMTVVVCAEPYCILPGGTELRGEACNFSICDYATQLLAGDPDPSLRALAVAMLNYGAATQRYSAYNIRDLANRNLSFDDRQFEHGFSFPIRSVMDARVPVSIPPPALFCKPGSKRRKKETVPRRLSRRCLP